MHAHTHKLTGVDPVCRLRGSGSRAEFPPKSEPGRRTTHWTKTHKEGKKKNYVNCNQRKTERVKRRFRGGESHLPEEAAQRHLPVSRCPQLLQQEVDALHADLLLQQLRAQLGEPVSRSLPTAHTRKTQMFYLFLLQVVSHFAFEVVLLVKCMSFSKVDLMDGALFLGVESDGPVHLPLYSGSNIKVDL